MYTRVLDGYFLRSGLQFLWILLIKLGSFIIERTCTTLHTHTVTHYISINTHVCTNHTNHTDYKFSLYHITITLVLKTTTLCSSKQARTQRKSEFDRSSCDKWSSCANIEQSLANTIDHGTAARPASAGNCAGCSMQQDPWATARVDFFLATKIKLKREPW